MPGNDRAAGRGKKGGGGRSNVGDDSSLWLYID